MTADRTEPGLEKPMRTAHSFCRICSAHCGMVLTIDENEHIVSIRGDKAQPLSHGYACFKGLQAEEAHHGPARLLRPLKRMPDGSHEEIPLEQALDEIAGRVGALIEANGPDAIALFNGNGGTPNSTGYPMTHAFLAALGSPSLYSTLSIDQSAKVVAVERMGVWAAGLQDINQSDVLLLLGTNPLVSHSTVPVIGPDPVRRLKAAKADGLKLIVIDPRRTETAYFADLFAQPLPGEDPAILSGLVRIILDEGWHDQPFCADYVGTEQMAALRRAVEPFTEDRVEERAGLGSGELRAIAEMFARDHRRGAAYAATGPCMAPFSNLTQHLIEVINVICGRLRRPGDPLVVDLTAPEGPITAEVIPPFRSWEQVPASRIRGVGRLGGERLTSTLAEEIMTPGAGQVRALFVNGGNPAATIPDRKRIGEALDALDLLVVVDPYMTATALKADYILPPRMQYERADLPLLIPNYPLQPENWLQFTPPVIAPPKGSDLTEDWYVYWSIAKRLGRQIVFVGQPLDMTTPPTAEALCGMRMKGARVDFEDLRRRPSGGLFANDEWRVQAPATRSGATFGLMPEDVAGELAAYRHAAKRSDSYPFLLTSRRMRDIFNTNGIHLEAVRARNPVMPIFLHPTDLCGLGLAEGDEVTIRSEHGAIHAIARKDEAMRIGVAAMSHSWGGLPDAKAESVNLLIDSTEHVETVNAMPRMSAIPVHLSRAAAGAV
jgi:anaerobic selenocysteine-containing dehydrogenase